LKPVQIKSSHFLKKKVKIEKSHPTTTTTTTRQRGFLHLRMFFFNAIIFFIQCFDFFSSSILLIQGKNSGLQHLQAGTPKRKNCIKARELFMKNHQFKNNFK
jgi:hypothetical protein